MIWSPGRHSSIRITPPPPNLPSLTPFSIYLPNKTHPKHTCTLTHTHTLTLPNILTHTHTHKHTHTHTQTCTHTHKLVWTHTNTRRHSRINLKTTDKDVKDEQQCGWTQTNHCTDLSTAHMYQKSNSISTLTIQHIDNVPWFCIMQDGRPVPWCSDDLWPSSHPVSSDEHVSMWGQFQERSLLHQRSGCRVTALTCGKKWGWGTLKCHCFQFLLLLCSQLYLWGSPFSGRFLHMWPFLTLWRRRKKEPIVLPWRAILAIIILKNQHTLTKWQRYLNYISLKSLISILLSF